MFNQNVSVIINIITFITLFIVWEPYLENIITIISFVSAGVTIAIREIIIPLSITSCDYAFWSQQKLV